MGHSLDAGYKGILLKGIFSPKLDCCLTGIFT